MQHWRRSLAASALFGAMATGGGLASATSEEPGKDHSDPSAQCADLEGADIEGARIVSAAFVEAGNRLSSSDDILETSFCRIEARFSAGADSEIHIQAWLPSRWNGKFLGLGGGGFEGGYANASVALRAPINAGFAALVTDAGHTTPANFAEALGNPAWALNRPEAVMDYGYRANHQGAIFGKSLANHYYGVPARKAYFHGCSNGGRDALMLAQRYPDDYDAIAAGAPANDFTGLMTSFLEIARVSRAPGVELTPEKLTILNEAVVKKCDAIDGLSDGLIESPRKCRFDPKVFQCRPGQTKCLSSSDIGAVRAIYKGVASSDGGQIMPGPAVGSEYQWHSWLTSMQSVGGAMGRGFFRNFVYNDPTWDPSQFALERDYRAARNGVGEFVDAVDQNLASFYRSGGKLLIYHGWDDAAIPAENSIRYFRGMRKRSGPRATAQSRLFMLPGVGHCAGGTGPGTVDYVAAIDNWAETGIAPDQLLAKPENMSRAMAGLAGPSLSTRRVCSWPTQAYYRGTGPVGEAESYICR